MIIINLGSDTFKNILKSWNLWDKFIWYLLQFWSVIASLLIPMFFSSFLVFLSVCFLMFSSRFIQCFLPIFFQCFLPIFSDNRSSFILRETDMVKLCIHVLNRREWRCKDMFKWNSFTKFYFIFWNHVLFYKILFYFIKPWIIYKISFCSVKAFFKAYIELLYCDYTYSTITSLRWWNFGFILGTRKRIYHPWR